MRLKHFLSVFLTILTLGISQAWATDVPITMIPTSSPTGLSWNTNPGSTQGDFEFTSTDDAITVSGTSAKVTANYLNIYAGGTMTFSSSSKIKSIVISTTTNGSSKTRTITLTSGGGSLSGNSVSESVASVTANSTATPEEVTWTNSSGSTSVSFSIGTGQTYFYSFEVTYESTGGSSTKCATPSISPAACDFYGSQQVTITTATADAAIYYTTDNTAPSKTNGTLYTTAFAVSDATTTVKAIAVKDGMTDSDVASVEYTYAGPAVTSYDIDFESVAAAYVNWEFNNIGIRSTITPHGGSYYGANVNSGGNGVQTASITTKAKYAAPGLLTFYISKESNNTTASYWKAQVSSNGTDWTDVQQFDAHSSAMNSGAKWNECIADLSAYTNVYVRISYGSSGAIRAIDDISLEAATAVIKPTISGTENFVTSTTVTLACATDGATIYYTTDGSDPKTSATKQTGTSFTLTNTATVRAIANKGSDWSNEATQKTFTKITPITVATAIGSIPNVDDAVDNQYVVGIVCTAGTSVNGSGQMTYYISDDGSETSRLQIYLGKNLDNSSFTATSDLALGDRVVVYGQLKNFKGTKEMNSGNYLIEKEDAVVSAPVFTPNGGGFMGETNVTITCATGSSNIYYTTDGSTTPSKSSTPYTEPIHLNATTTIKAIAYVGDDASVVITKSFTLTAPMTVAEALTALDSQDPINNAAVVGIISTAPASNPSSGKLTYYISDDGTTDDELEVYLGFGLNGASFSNKTDLQVGDQVTVFGNLTIFSTTTKEFAQGSRLIAFNRPAVDLNSITLPTTANVKVGKTVTLTPTFDPTNATDKTVSWTSDDELIATVVDGVVTGVAAGTVDITVTYTADPTIKATCAVTVSEAPSFDDPTNEWQLVTSDAQLVAGKYYVIVSSSKNKTATSTITSGYTGEASSTVTDGAIAYDALGANTAVFQLGGNSIDGWTLNEVVAQDKLLGGATTANLTWGTGTTTWPITIDASNNAIIGASDGYRILHNVNNNRFKPYNSATSTIMLLPQLYVWTLKTYKLRYNANGGEDAPATQSADGEGKATVTTAIPTAPTDKVFERWNTQYDGNGTDKAAGDVIDLSTADVTLYAIWRDPETVTISYDANGGEGSIDADVDQVEGTQYTIKANTFTRDGYSFIGWKAYDALDNELTITSNKITIPSTNVTIKAQWGELTVTDFILVTNVNQLQDGDKVYIVAAGSGNAIGTQNTNYRDEVAVLKQGSRVVIYNATPVEFTLGKVGGNYTFQAADGYIFASGTANSGKNYMNTKAEVDDACKWTITIDDEGNTEIKSVENGYTPYMQHNASSHRFACYHTANQQAVVLYKKANYTRAMTEGRYGTICLPNSGVLLGADLYEVAYYGETSKKIFFDEILSGVMEAGVPYVFLPQEGVNKLAVVYTDDADAAATNRNGLVGFIGDDEDAETSVPAGMYILQNNQYREVLAGADARIKSYRAYINLGAITPIAPALAPGRRRISMGVASENSATGMDELNASETPVKMMIDGQLYILRGEKLYDATGRLVK